MKQVYKEVFEESKLNASIDYLFKQARNGVTVDVIFITS